MTAWTTTSIASRHLRAVLDAAGRPVDDLLAAAGVDRATLASADAAMPLAAFDALWARAAAVQPDIGLRLVDRFPAGQMHVLAHLALRSATVGAALDDVCRYSGVASAADRLTLERHGDVARVTYACIAPGSSNPWMAEHYFAMASAFLRQATGRDLPLRDVAFAASAQAPAASYRQRFGRDPRFGAGANTLEFDAPALDWPLLTHDAYLHDILERVARERQAAPPDSLLDAVRRAIGTAILRGDTPAIDAVAATCRLGTRALRQRLAGENTSFRQVLDEVRRDLAREHLQRGLSVTEAAYLLGFSEPAAFQHACRRWFGTSAGEARRALARRAGGE
jgi:AraC-like DNA-binding protein